jgi:hypothetical protein
MPPFQSPQTMIREDLVRIVLAGLIHFAGMSAQQFVF